METFRLLPFVAVVAVAFSLWMFVGKEILPENFLKNNEIARSYRDVSTLVARGRHVKRCTECTYGVLRERGE